MQKPLLVASIAGTCFVLSAVIGGLIGARVARHGGLGGGHPSDPVLWQAPSYHGLTDQLGHKVDSSQFAGKVRVVTFLFPYCTSYCPLIAAHLVGFEHLLADTQVRDQVQIVAFDVDPAGSGPKQMRAFLKEYGWDPHDLHLQYLTGKPKTIRHVVTGGYHVGYQKISDDNGTSQASTADDETPQVTVVNHLAKQVDYDVSHNDGLVLVDPRGRVRAVFDQADTLSGRRLLSKVRSLLPGPS